MNAATKPISIPQASLWPYLLGLALGLPLAGMLVISMFPIYEWYGQALHTPFNPSWSPSSWTWPGVHVVEALNTRMGFEPWRAQPENIFHVFGTMVFAGAAFGMNLLALALALHLLAGLMHAVHGAFKNINQ